MLAVCVSVQRLEAAKKAKGSDPAAQEVRLAEYVDPKIGSEGLGRVFVGPSAPFGMVKPSPDCTVAPNSGWLPMPTQVNGFAQVHVSGTGGGPKYGNILIQPFVGESTPKLAPVGTRFEVIDYRDNEDISLGYYATKYKNSGIFTEVTTTPRASVYRISYPKGDEQGLLIDAGFFLGEHKERDVREAQQFVGSQIQVISDTEVRGYNRVRGGWNNGKAYTVYFCLRTDRPAIKTTTWKSGKMTDSKEQIDSSEQTGAVMHFADSEDTLNVRIGISFISELKAKENLEAYTEGKSFDTLHAELLDSWEALLSRIKIDPQADNKLKRMFYTALYHTMIMPTDRTGENPLWDDPVPYYDDFYAIWDTYRSSSPLITLIDPEREAEIVNSLINIWKRDGYMPDARSGNSNGRTQGGSNAEIVLADAFVKGLKGIDYEQALLAMRKDAEVDPGANHEAEGRGGLREYLELGYIPHGVARAGNRTVEYSYDDYAIYLVAKGLGYDDLAEKYLKQSGNWKNLWRDDYEHDGTKGFIMPRDAEGNWLDDLTFGHSAVRKPTFRYNPVMFEGPWYKPWWDMFFYEASSWEYSLSIPHDVEGLIEKCGGPEAFEERLDKFFDKKYFNVNNEPSFLSPCLYHWIGKPERSSDRILEIIAENYSDTPQGLPGNDDSGAMSSWLAFHMMGLYPNAGQDYYLIHTPVLRESEIALADGKSFRIVADNLSEKNRYIQSATLNGQEHSTSFLKHADLAGGGELRLKMGSKPHYAGAKKADRQKPGAELSKRDRLRETKSGSDPVELLADTLLFVYKLHGQTRKFQYVFTADPDGGITLHWGIERNLKWWSGTYRMTPEAVENGSSLSYRMPEDGNNITLPMNETFAMISRKAYRDLISEGMFVYDGVQYEIAGDPEPTKLGTLLPVTDAEGAELWILDNPQLPLIVGMQNNPLEIDWKVEYRR
ncbi:MAG: GH92 family glycosyl hydrolase [Muribaculaceae bacterium]|nr:GH92 family glycosyl hydrolase [Muribaculaceae bacterium]